MEITQRSSSDTCSIINTSWPALENNLSDGTEDPGIHRYFYQLYLISESEFCCTSTIQEDLRIFQCWPLQNIT